jgi:acetyl-CoA carboxylase carboxyltransferase component
VGDSALEVYEQMNPVVRTFLVRRGRRTVGVFVNPPGHPNNLVTVETLNRYDAGLSLFKSMGIPIVSFLDTPGIDPRFEQQDDDIVRLIVRVAKRIIEYPHGHMGVVSGRAFGGATTLGFPKNFRSQRCVAVKGCQIGVMSESILEQVLENSPRLLEIRREMRKAEPEDLYQEVEHFLALADVEAEQRATMRRLHDELSELPAERMQPALRRLRPAAGYDSPLLRPRWREGARAQSRHLPPKYSR